MPQDLFLPIEEDDPAARLRRLAEGTRLRVHLAESHPDSHHDDGSVLSAELRGVQDAGVVAAWKREAEHVSQVLSWDSIRRIEARLRASRRGTSWGVVSMIAFGSCGSALDHLPGDARSHLGAAGLMIGFLIGLLMWRLTSEWRIVYETPRD